MEQDEVNVLLQAGWEAWHILRKFEDDFPKIANTFGVSIDPFDNKVSDCVERLQSALMKFSEETHFISGR